ncbi:MAG: RNA-guided pseudouridylation complex pseudouridine synthase subunit Cbf5, partial [Euryarchaeota archaeon]|nr:RNA-guided pseudouridylation complex pseudouridine synthase subunit Cbf5 [Euryarchaeota archaeon]
MARDRKRDDGMLPVADANAGPFGSPPGERQVAQLLESSVVVIDKPAGPTSHQVAAWTRDMLGVGQAGHGGTLDPQVTGVLPVAVGRATRALRVMQESRKEYICVMAHAQSVAEDALREQFTKFTGPLFQVPPKQAAVKRQLRVRRVYELELLEHAGHESLFRVACEGGTYIRNLCHDIGRILGSGSSMAQLRRSASGPFGEGDAVPLVALRDAFAAHSDGDDAPLCGLLRPLEELLGELPRMELKDSAVDAVCHGADLGGPGVAAVSSSLKRGQLVALLTLRGEAVALARATRHADEMAGAEGTVARL